MLLDPVGGCIVAGLDPDIPVSDMRTFDEVVNATVAPQRFSATLFVAFSVLALLLATTPVYTVLSCSIGRRTSEIWLTHGSGGNGSVDTGNNHRAGNPASYCVLTRKCLPDASFRLHSLWASE